jgi:hypothetical protein
MGPRLTTEQQAELAALVEAGPQFDGDKISHMTKIWNAGMALKELGWA